MASRKPGQRVSGRYEIRALVAEKPLGTLYRAFDREIEVEVALRLIAPELLPDAPSRRAFVDRLGRSRSIQHPNLVRLFDVALDGEEAAVAVQWVPGPSLRERIEKREWGTPPVPVGEARLILQKVRAGIAHAHQHGLILGDLRADTVVLVGETLKLSNVGIGPALPRKRYVEAMRGSEAFGRLAPEIRNGGVPDVRSDVFSFAMLTYELLCGAVPDPVPRPSPAVPPSLVALLARALADDPLLRPAGIEALAEEIDRLLAGAPLPSPKRRPAPAASLDDETVRTEKVDEHEEVTRHIDPEELRRLQGDEVTRRASVEEIFNLRSQSAERTNPAVEIEASYEGAGELELEAHRLADGTWRSAIPQSEPEPDEHERTEPILLLDPKAAKTSPKARLEEEEGRTIPVPRSPSPDRPPSQPTLAGRKPTPTPESKTLLPPPPRPPAAPSTSGVRTPPPALLWPPAPAAMAPAAAAGPPPLVAAPVLAAPSPARPVSIERPPTRTARRDPRQRKRTRVAATALALIAGLTLVAITWGVVSHMHRVAREQKERLAEQLNAEADLVRRVGPQRPRPLAVSPAVALPDPPVARAPAAATSGPCPLGSNLVEGNSPFCVDVYEYPGGRTLPRTDVAFAEAQRLCQLRGERLCSAAEWERACRGKSGASYPYGQSFDATRCNTAGGGGELAASGTFASCRSASGAYDMSGNVAEWVIYKGQPAQKGGSAITGNPQARCSTLLKDPQPGGAPFVGFRCCGEPR